jgi:hypothetical protein
MDLRMQEGGAIAGPTHTLIHKQQHILWEMLTVTTLMLLLLMLLLLLPPLP